MTGNEFIGKCISEMVRSNISVQFNRRRNNSKNAANFFDSDKRKFVINLFESPSDDYLLEIFIHEYCHFRQWRYSRQRWKAYDKSYDVFERWLKGERKFCPIEVIRDIQLLELDCDKKVLEYIKNLSLPIDVSKYIKSSNSYILSYNLVYKYRKFFNMSAFDHPDIIKLMTDKQLSPDILGELPVGYEEIFMRESK